MRRSRRACVLVLLALLAGCKADLYSHLGERDAVEMVAVLARGGIDADRVVAKDGTSTLRVDKARLPEAVSLLEANRYPRNEFSNLGEVFEQKGIVSSPIAERARFIYAMSQEISRTLSDIDGVLTARVHIVLPHNDPLRDGDEPAAAAVFVRYDARAGIDQLVPQIKMLVANSIEGLSYDKVSVVALPVALPPPGPVAPAEAGSAGGVLSWAPWLAVLLIPAAGGTVLAWRRREASASAAVKMPVAAPVAAEKVATADKVAEPQPRRPARPSLRSAA